MVKKQDNITLNIDLGKMTGAGKNPKSDNRKKDLFETLYLGDDYEPPKREEDYSDELEKIPQFGDHTLLIPPFFAVQSKTGWRLANPLTEMRNLANRKKQLSVNIIRTNVPEPKLEMEEPDEIPTLDQFSAKDQAKLKAYFEAVKQGKEKEYLTKNKPRGFPAVLYKNAKKAGLKETNEKVYTKNVKAQKKPKAPKALTSEAKRAKTDITNKIGTIPELTEVTDIKKYVKDLILEVNQQNEELTSKRLTEIGRIKDYLRDYVRAKELPQYLFNALSKALSSNYSIGEKEQKNEKEKAEAEAKAKAEAEAKAKAEAEAEEEAKLQAEAKAFAARARARQKAKTTGGKIVPVPPTPPPPPPTTAVVPPNIAPPPETTEERDRRMRQEGNARLRKRLVRGGELPKGLNPLDIIPKGLKAIKDKVVDIAQKVIKGRDGYSPSVTAIIEKFADQEVKSIELHRRVLPTVYTGLLNVLTLGEFNKRIKDQPKDKLFHISMWVKLANGKTVLVEKNEVINMKVNPKKEKEEEVQPAGAVPSVFTFGEMLDKTQKQMGGKYFTYSARDNNCGNYIEAVLKANGMNTEATNAFIGQDAKAILKGYPRIAKALNVITDTAGRANVLMEGGGMSESESESECECEMEGSGASSSVQPLSNEEAIALEILYTLSASFRREPFRISPSIKKRFDRLTSVELQQVIRFLRGDNSQFRVMGKIFKSSRTGGPLITKNQWIRLRRTEPVLQINNPLQQQLGPPITSTPPPTPPNTPPQSEIIEGEEEMNGEGLMSGRGFHVATMTNRFHRIPQSESQVKSFFQGSSMEGTGTTFGRQRVAPVLTPAERFRIEAVRIAADREADRAARVEQEAREAAAEAERQRQLESGSAIRATTQEVMALPSAAAYPIVIAKASKKNTTNRVVGNAYAPTRLIASVVPGQTGTGLKGTGTIFAGERLRQAERARIIEQIIARRSAEVAAAAEAAAERRRQLESGNAIRATTQEVMTLPSAAAYPITEYPISIAEAVPEPPARGTGLKKPKFVNDIVKLANKTLTPKMGKKIASTLIHDGVPAVIGGVSGATTTAITGNPALGIAVGAVAKKYAGKKAEDELSKTTGYGMKKPKMVKGSQEAKDYMKMLRDKRGKK